MLRSPPSSLPRFVGMTPIISRTHVRPALLLHDSIDYAGLFPPAGLDMAAAVANYATYRGESRRLGPGPVRVPVARLAEFEAAAERCLPRRPYLWRLAALLGADSRSELQALGEFNCRHAADGARRGVGRRGRGRRPTRSEASSAICGDAALPPGVRRDPDRPGPGRSSRRIGRRCRAKVRTGGVTADAFPAASRPGALHPRVPRRPASPSRRRRGCTIRSGPTTGSPTRPTARAAPCTAS